MKAKICGYKLVTVIFLVLIWSPLRVNAHKNKPHAAMHVAVSSDQSAVKKINGEYVLSVKPIFLKSCFDCHSSSTNYPWYSKIPGPKQLVESDIAEARKHLDFSKDFPFSGHGSPREDIEAIGQAVDEGSMPPFRYRIMHWGSGLKEDEKLKIKIWVDKSLKLLQTSETAPRETSHGH